MSFRLAYVLGNLERTARSLTEIGETIPDRIFAPNLRPPRPADRKARSGAHAFCVRQAARATGRAQRYSGSGPGVGYRQPVGLASGRTRPLQE